MGGGVGIVGVGVGGSVVVERRVEIGCFFVFGGFSYGVVILTIVLLTLHDLSCCSLLPLYGPPAACTCVFPCDARGLHMHLSPPPPELFSASILSETCLKP